jgi:ribose-phosphate pyrophosphokinase
MIKINGQEIVIKTFPNGESRIVEESFVEATEFGNSVDFKYESDADLLKLMLVKKYLDDTHFQHPNHLTIYYMPYSRMDRSENDSPFTLKYVAEFINSLNFDFIEVIEPHSDVTCALLNRAKPNYINFELVEKVKALVDFDNDTDFIVFPDAGASKRYSQMRAKNILVGHKHRDFQTGQIDSLDLIGDLDTSGTKAIIVDDLSSYGGTFVRTAEALHEFGIDEVYLLVAHAENSIFKGKLFDYIRKVFTTDSILTEQGNWENQKYKRQLHIFEIEGENA